MKGGYCHSSSFPVWPFLLSLSLWDHCYHLLLLPSLPSLCPHFPPFPRGRGKHEEKKCVLGSISLCCFQMYVFEMLLYLSICVSFNMYTHVLRLSGRIWTPIWQEHPFLGVFMTSLSLLLLYMCSSLTHKHFRWQGKEPLLHCMGLGDWQNKRIFTPRSSAFCVMAAWQCHRISTEVEFGVKDPTWAGRWE